MIGLREQRSLAIATVLVLGSVASLASGCGTKTAALPKETGELVESMRGSGQTVELVGEARHPFFTVPGHKFRLAGGELEVYEYPVVTMAKAEALTVSGDGSNVGTLEANWPASPHFYAHGSLIVVYLGEDATVQTLLARNLGPSFAGKGAEVRAY